MSKPTYEELEAQLHAVVAEMAELKANVEAHAAGFAVCPVCSHEEPCETDDIVWMTRDAKTPATDAAIAALRAESRKEGAIFAANRMLAAWDAGFVDDTPENAADIARAILSMTEFMDDAPAGDFDRSFADEMLSAIAAQLRQSVQVKGVQS